MLESTPSGDLQVHGRLCDTGELATVTISHGRITRIDTGTAAYSVLPEHLNTRTPERPLPYLSPAFHDIQVNGYGGYDFNGGAWNDPAQAADSIWPMFELLARAGTALVCPTICTQSEKSTLRNLSAIARAMESDPRIRRAVTGIHVEGPYISPEDGPRGAHPLQHVRKPDWDEFRRFQEAAGGNIRILTLAPELEGALPLIEKVAESGVVVALGHTGAEPETIRDAVRAGARLSTHLGNGAHSQIRRHPNYIWEQLASDSLYASIIADGHHLPPSVVKSIARVKGPEKLILVSDAVSLGGLPPGIYGEGRVEVLPNGKVVLAGTPYLSGAGHLLDTCVSNALRFSDLAVAHATACASAIPARLLGMEDHKGHLRVGSDADLTLFRIPDEGPLEIAATLCGGEVVYHA